MADLLVIGSGVAGLIAALTAAETHTVTVVTKSSLKDSNTYHAQGGIAAAVATDDSSAAHLADTLAAGAGLSRSEAARVLCEEGPDRIRDLIALGVEFDRDGDSLARGLEAAHSHARVLHAGGDATGAAIETALIRALRASGVRILEHTFVADLLVRDGAAIGVEAIDRHGRHCALRADAVILASGGAGQLFKHTTNPVVATGDGVAAAWRAGARLADVEFYQFHPTALAGSGNFLISEAVRGEGAVLRNRAGERFMLDLHPDAELAPRDVVARGIAVEMQAQAGEPVRLDATALGAAFLQSRFPTIDAACRRAGLDWAREPIPVTPAAHYWMGGIATDLDGRSSLPGLFAVGEAACTGAHGANRLASNSLLEAVVFAHRAGLAVGGLDATTASRPGQHQAEVSAVSALPTGPELPVLLAAVREDRAATVIDRRELQSLLWDFAGVHRSGDGLSDALGTLSTWRAADSTAATIHQREDANLLDLARLVVTAALARTESRGAHFRSDFPSPAPGAFASTESVDRLREVAVSC